MKCPNCNYKYGNFCWWDEEDKFHSEDINGEDGDFYELEIKAEKKENYYENRKSIYGCPKCGIMFMDIN